MQKMIEKMKKIKTLTPSSGACWKGPPKNKNKKLFEKKKPQIVQNATKCEKSESSKKNQQTQKSKNMQNTLEPHKSRDPAGHVSLLQFVLWRGYIHARNICHAFVTPVFLSFLFLEVDASKSLSLFICCRERGRRDKSMFWMFWRFVDTLTSIFLIGRHVDVFFLLV